MSFGEEISLRVDCSYEDDPTCPQDQSLEDILIPCAKYHLQSQDLLQGFQSVLQTVPGRVQEATKIFQLIVNAEKGSSTPVCLHGNTGCGKTTLVLKVLNYLQSYGTDITTAYVNCMQVCTVNQIYGLLLSKLFGLKGKKPEKALDELFRNTRKTPNRQLRIIVLDEVDQFAYDSSFLYNILEWIHLPESRIVLFLISNVIDLTIRLEGKLKSRLRFETIIFRPYSYEQIERISLFKFPHLPNMFTQEAWRFLSKKIANVNSDIRLLEKIHEELVQTHVQSQQRNRLINVQDVQIHFSKIGAEFNIEDALTEYRSLIQTISRLPAKSQISTRLIYGSSWNEQTRQDATKNLRLSLAELEDMGFIKMFVPSNCSDITFQGVNIQVSEHLRLFCQQE